VSDSKDQEQNPSLTNTTDDAKFLAQVVGNLIAFQERHMKTQDTIVRRDLFWRNMRAAILALAFVIGPVIYSFGLSSLLSGKSINEDYVALVRVEGPIDAGTKANANKINESLRAAFEDEQSEGVVVLINSPGGSPVQSSLINERIRSLREMHPQKKLWVVGEDYVTSGAYFIAVASDNICVNRSTMTGSIGVIISGWGLDKLIDRYNIERRVFTAGENKNRLDMFSEMSEPDQEKVDALLGNLHNHFIEAVRVGREDKLRAEPLQLFSGDYWTGEEALKMGLVDGLCNLPDVLESEFGVRQVKDYTEPPSLFASFSNRFGAYADEFINARSVARPMYMP
jgi:protease IV